MLEWDYTVTQVYSEGKGKSPDKILDSTELLTTMYEYKGWGILDFFVLQKGDAL